VLVLGDDKKPIQVLRVWARRIRGTAGPSLQIVRSLSRDHRAPNGTNSRVEIIGRSDKILRAVSHIVTSFLVLFDYQGM
jgi:hypothetical protein